MKGIEQVGVVGVGLMGASLALSLKKWAGIKQVIGIDPCPRNLELALEKDIIDAGFLHPHPSLEDCTVLFLAPPVDAVVNVFQGLVNFLAPGTIVSDMGSTKGQIVQKVEALIPAGIHFIGGHPMTGSEKIGPQHADPFLFENAFYILTPTKKTPAFAQKSLTRLLQAIGALVITLDPKQHDYIVAAISHLPQLVATALINTIFQEEGNPYLSTLAAGGLKDTTRIADANPRMWKGIFSSNRWELQQFLSRFQKELQLWEETLQGDKGEQMEKMLTQARDRRRNIPEREKGLLPRFFEIHVAIPDRPMVLGTITSLIGEQGINISEIEILKIREQGGALRLGFGNARERDQAQEILRDQGFKIQ